MKKKASTSKETKKQKKTEVKKPKILPNVKFNLFVMVILLLMIILLFSGIIYVQNKIIINLAENNQVDYFDENFREYLVEKYTLEEFKEATDTEKLISMADIEGYMIRNNFTNIEIDTGFIQAEKRGDCIYEKRWDAELCRVLMIRFVQEKGIYIEVVKAREFAN